jgi:hypothetical protein
MRLSELLGRRVVDADGRRLGDVKDVRLVQDGPLIEGFGHALRVEGVLVGRGAIGVRLGIVRTDVKGPWPLTWLLRRLEHHARYVDWNDVAEHDTHLQLRPGARLIDVAELDGA